MLAQLLSDVRVATPNPEPANVELCQADIANARKVTSVLSTTGLVWYVASC